MPRILSGSIVPGLRKLKKENERLKKIIAEKELEVALLQDAYKKNEEEKSLIADYRSRELNVSRILTLLNIPRSTHYYSPASL